MEDSGAEVHFYCILHNLRKTLKCFYEELPSKQNATHETWHKAVLQAFDKGNRQEFFSVWEEYIPEMLKKDEYEKLEFYAQIYFTVLPLILGNKEAWNSEIKTFKEFLNTKGAELCKTSQFLPFYALPHIQEPQKHPTFQKFFTQNWTTQLRSRIEKYLKSFVEKPQTDNSKELKNELAKSRHREEYLRNALIESNSKWTSFSMNLLDISSQLLQHIDGEAKANLGVLRRKLHELGKFLVSSEESVSNTSSVLPVVGKEQLGQLNFAKLKQDLFKRDSEERVCALLQALRWRLTRTPASVRMAVLQDYSSNDILQLQEAGLSLLLRERPPKLTEFASKLANVIASDGNGRSYLLQDPHLIPTLVRILHQEKSDSILRQNAIGILQKLSLRKRPQTLMIQLKVIEWLVAVLAKDSELSDYSLEYSAALLMNLSLRTPGKAVCEQVDILELLKKLIVHRNPNVRTYINGTLYSILTKDTFKQKAREMGFESLLEKLYQDSDEAFRNQIFYILEQMKCEYEDSCYSEEEAEDDEPPAEEESISDEEDAEDLLDYSGLLGEDLLKHYIIPTSSSPTPAPSFISQSPQDNSFYAFKPPRKLPSTPIQKHL